MALVSGVDGLVAAGHIAGGAEFVAEIVAVKVVIHFLEVLAVASLLMEQRVAVQLAGQQLPVMVVLMAPAFLFIQELAVSAGILRDMAFHTAVQEGLHEVRPLDGFLLAQRLLGKEFVEQLQGIGDYIVQTQFVVGIARAEDGRKDLFFHQSRIFETGSILKNIIRQSPYFSVFVEKRRIDKLPELGPLTGIELPEGIDKFGVCHENEYLSAWRRKGNVFFDVIVIME